MSTLSVVTTTTASPSVTGPPTSTSHSSTVPNSIVIDIFGINSGTRGIVHHSPTSADAAATMSSTCGTVARSSFGL